jgi:diguanylate cyclase (GGDEF)-like protein
LDSLADGVYFVDLDRRHKRGHRVPVAVRVSAMTNSMGETIGGVETFSENSSKIAALEKVLELEKLAYIDPLTGVGNRRFTDQALREHWERFRREREAFAVLFVDLDRFKSVNDVHGHDAGDAVLQAVSKTLANSIRSFDFIGRWGGEEFVVLLSKGDGARARIVAERCCALVRSCVVDGGPISIRSSISIGIAIQPVMARPDANLYIAKQTGRDQAVGP